MASPIQNSYQDQVTPYGRKEIILVVSVIAFALAVRLVFWRGILSNDEFNYLRVAGDMWKGQFHLRDVLYLHGTRPLVFMPAVWMFALFGVSDAAAVAWPVLASLLTVLTIYAIARRLYGKETAAYAALLACISPLMVKESTRMLPGAIMNFIIALSALCFIASEQTSKRRSLWLLASGVVFGLMPLAGEVGLVFGCFFPLALLLWRRHAVPSYWPVAAGFAAVTALILLYYWRETGNPMFKAAISRFILENEVQPPRPIYYVRYLLQPLASHGGVFFLSGLAAVVSLFERRRETWLLAAWFIVTVLFIEAGSSSVTAYRPLYKSLRYLSVASVPGVLLAGEAISWLRARAGRATAMTQRPATGAGAAAAVLLVLFAACWLTLRLNSRAVDERRSQLHAIRDLVRSHEGEVIYVTHWMWNARVAYFMRFADGYMASGYDPYHAVRLATADPRSKDRYVQTLAPGSAMSPGLLLNDERLLEASRGVRRTGYVQEGEIPAVLADVPKTWPLLEHIEIAGESSLAIYEIPQGSHWPSQ